MKPYVLITAAILFAATAAAQRHKIGEINAETEEGKFLQGIATEEDAARKVTMMEEFVSKFGKHEAAGWVWSQLQPAYAKAGNHDKVLQAGKTLLALDAADIDAAFANLKASEAKKDADGVVNWAIVASDIARKTAAAPKTDDQEADEYKHAVDFAKQVETYTEYALYAAAVNEQDPAKVLKLADTLEQRNPQGQYVPQILPKYAWAARQGNAMPAAVAFGERAYARDQVNEDLLLAMADHYMNAKNAEKALLYSNKLVELLGSKPKPEGLSDADWDKKKSAMIGLGHWMAGSAYAQQRNVAQVDKSFRAALPYIKDNDQLLGPALFQLGLANYQMGKGKNAAMMADAVRFTQQCAGIKGPMQAQAQKNLTVMRKETGRAK